MAGSKDEAFNVDEYEPLLKKHTCFGEYVILDGMNHIEITTDSQASDLVFSWIKEIQEYKVCYTVKQNKKTHLEDVFLRFILI